MARVTTDTTRARERAERKVEEARQLAEALAHFERLDRSLIDAARNAEQRERQAQAQLERARAAVRTATEQRVAAIAALAAAVRATGVPPSIAAGLLGIPSHWLSAARDGDHTARGTEPQRDDHPPALPTLHPGAA